jgi:hypothetical protein
MSVIRRYGVAMQTLSYYAQPGRMTSAGQHAPLLDGLPRDVAGLARVGHGLLIHEHLAEIYGVQLSEADRSSVHIRPADELLDRIVARDARPLADARPAAGRVACNCRHFTVVMVTMLRAQGTPARARCGFGAYFTDGFFEDHWVCEYWHAAQRRWALVDAQIDERQRARFGIGFDLTDVPRDQFVVAGQAWQQCRAGEADPDRFGLSFLKEAGLWWVAANLMRDAAALCNIELLPWDIWGAMPEPDTLISDEELALFDRLAALTLSPDRDFAQFQKICGDDRLRVPATVRNALRGRDEPI